MDEVLTKQIKMALEQLTAVFNGNQTTVTEMVSLFVSETPGYAQQLGQLINNQDWSGASFLLHKVKSRFGYLNLDDTAEQLSQWEQELLTGVNHSLPEQQKRAAHFQSLTKNIVDILNTINSQNNSSPTLQNLPLTGKTVLVAEDDEINAMVFELFVKELGGDVIKAVDGHEAVQFTLEKRPDLIFMDVHMPFFSGLDAVKELRTRGVTCPVISLSASTRLNEKQNSLDAGANDFLIKPANRNSINGILLKYLC